MNFYTLASPDDYRFIEAVKNSFLSHHINTPTRGKDAKKPSKLDLVFISIEEAIEDTRAQSPLGKSDYSLIKLIYYYEAENLGIKLMFDCMKDDYKKCNGCSM